MTEPENQPESLGLTSFHQPPDDQGLSLDRINAAFAEMLGSGLDPYEDPPEETPAEDEAAARLARLTGSEPQRSDDEDDACEVTPRTILEAMLFVGNPQNEPLTAERVSKLMRGVRPAEIDELVCELNADYVANRCPYTIRSEGAGYRLVLRDEYAPLRDQFYGRVRQARLSPAAIEVLALVAYHEPLTAEEVSKMRGTPSGPILNQLVRRQLLRIERTDSRPRITRYYTTQRFLDLFGIQSLADLPRSQEIDKQ